MRSNACSPPPASTRRWNASTPRVPPVPGTDRSASSFPADQHESALAALQAAAEAEDDGEGADNAW